MNKTHCNTTEPENMHLLYVRLPLRKPRSENFVIDKQVYKNVKYAVDKQLGLNVKYKGDKIAP